MATEMTADKTDAHFSPQYFCSLRLRAKIENEDMQEEKSEMALFQKLGLNVLGVFAPVSF